MSDKPPIPCITAVIATRNRGASVVNTVKSIFENNCCNFKVIIVDQSDNKITSEALAQYSDNERFLYLPMETTGLGKAHNLGIKNCETELIAITDDDCEVPVNWLQSIIEAFNDNPKVGMILGNTIAGPFDDDLGFIPYYQRTQLWIQKTPWLPTRPRGMGACMGLRRSAWEKVGGFDEMLGPGGALLGGEDADMALRLVLNRFQVLETPEIHVLHYGFRTKKEYKASIYRDVFGVGVTLIKPIRCGYFSIIPLFITELLKTILPFVWNLIRLKRPLGWLLVKGLVEGMYVGLKTPIDKKTCHYCQQARKSVQKQA